MTMFKFVVLIACMCVVAADFAAYEKYCQKHGKRYTKEKMAEKFKTYTRNVLELAKLKLQLIKEKMPYEVEENCFTDMDDAERAQYVLPSGFLESPEFQEFNKSARVARSMAEWQTMNANRDWRLYNVMPAVRNQGQCGSCWSFATVNAIEVQYAQLGNGLYEFSEQQLVDCETHSAGCNGGYTYQALNFSIHRGNALRSQYPYQTAKGVCKTNVPSYLIVQSYKRLDTIGKMEYFLYYAGPLIFQMWVPNSLYAYKSGIFYPNDADCTATNNKGGHAMSIVGYGTQNGIAYWIVRNSWGPTWGDDGYLRIVKGVNKCSMEAYVYAPWCRGQTIQV